MEGKLYRAGSKVEWYFRTEEVIRGEILLRITTISGLSHNSIIFLKENGGFFKVGLSKFSCIENLNWLGLDPA